MPPKLIPMMLLAALTSCGGASNQVAQMRLTSDAFQNGQPIPAQFTCDGANQAPTLHWSEPPPGTKSFALVLDDPDAPSGTFLHWGVADIPPSARSIGGAQRTGTEVTNDFGKPGYGGPCPPRGNGPHHYRFKLYALDVDGLELPPDAKVDDVEREAKQHQVAMAQITGTYERK